MSPRCWASYRPKQPPSPPAPRSHPLPSQPPQRPEALLSSNLAAKTCVPCRGGVPPLKADAIVDLLAELGGGWRAVEDHHLEKEYRFKNFAEALAFTNAVGAIAEEQGHHPDIDLAWGKVGLKIWTHKIDGLTESDFVLAAKADQALEGTAR